MRGFIYIGQLNPTELGDFCQKNLPWPGKVPTINTQQRLSLLQAQPINGDFYIGLYKENSDEICLGYDQCSSCMYSSFFFYLLYFNAKSCIYCVFFIDQYYWSNFSHVLGSKAELNDLQNIFTNIKDDDVLLRYRSETNTLDGNSNRNHAYCEIALGIEKR